MELHYGAQLPIHVDELGLEGAGNTATFSVERGGSVKSGFLMETFQQVDDVMVSNGVATESEVALARRAMTDPAFVYRSPAMVAVWGRKPVSACG
ncbi:hypothetical protein [Mycolicibacterium sp. CBMA 295]|nr:hypothetical protein [Mycolicibacterium sp. CBMA 295]